MGLKSELLKYGLKGIGKSGHKFNTKKIARYAIVIVIGGLISLILTIVLLVLLIRWVWNSGNNVVQQNPTISSVVESTKQEASKLIPTVPSSPEDFIANNQVDTAKLNQVYNDLPTETQTVWKNAITAKLNESIQNATGTELSNLQNLLSAVQAL